MNLILLDNSESRVFPAETPEANHLRNILKVVPGSTFWCGIKNGGRGLATVTRVSESGDIAFSVEWEKSLGDVLPPVRLIVGLSRPQTMKKVFAVASEIGCSRIDVFQTEKGDPAYAQSSLWKAGDATLAEILEKSAEQTCVPALPEFSLHRSLAECLASADEKTEALCVALDVYADEKSFAQIAREEKRNAMVLAIGPERGWSERERETLRKAGFAFAHLGGRVLRVETAVSVALSVSLATLDFWRPHRVLTPDA